MSSKKPRKNVPRRPAPTPRAAAPPASPPSPPRLAPALPVSGESRTGLPTSPLAREQERDLEVGLTFTGFVCGGLTGFSQVPFGAPEGNVAGGVLGAVLGAMMGLSLSKSLFLSVRAQWFVWMLLAVLTVGGYWVGAKSGGNGPIMGATAGCAVATGFLLFGLRPLALYAQSKAPPVLREVGKPAPVVPKRVESAEQDVSDEDGAPEIAETVPPKKQENAQPATEG
ncbi:MAG: hypothetical protein FJX76_15400 [Armatimonadetes bacterium]|nr:hypothetical protein [Armatimonadota bacterium]